MELRLNNIEEQNLKGSLKLVRTLTLKIFSGLSLRFQVAGYLLFIAGEVASSNGRPKPPPEEVFEVQLLPFFERHYRPKKAIFARSRQL